MATDYHSIVLLYESFLAEHGDSHFAVGWPNLNDAHKRYTVMLDLLRGNQGTILDFGCGCSGLLDFANSKGIKINYSGLDLSEKFLSTSKKKYPQINYYNTDVLREDLGCSFDYVLMNGVLTVKNDLDFDSMWDYSKKLIKKVFDICDVGIAFNLMSKNVDWERDDLFHVPIELLDNFLYKNLSRNRIIRQDYGLYEYTVYVYKRPFDIQ